MFSTSHYNQTFTRRTNKRISVSQMLYDIVIDLLQESEVLKQSAFEEQRSSGDKQ